MRFHLPSFLIGYGAGATTVLLQHRVRPLLLEIATSAYRLADSIVAHVVMRREDLQDLLAEARARARGLFVQPSEPARPSA